ncbi:hypothetical protein LguiA_004592 [Lonicera macranthoides]
MNALAEYMVKGLEAKENMDNNLVASFCYGNLQFSQSTDANEELKVQDGLVFIKS